MITSTANKKIKEIVNINKKASYRKNVKLFIAEGIKLFMEADGGRIREVFISESFYKSIEGEAKKKLESLNYEIVSDKVFSSFSDTKTPQGILAIVEQTEYTLDAILKKKYIDNKKAEHNLLILEGIQDPGNLGTMIRSGEGAGITGIIMDKNTVDVYNSKVIRSTMGSVFRVPHIYVDDLPKTIEILKENNILVYAARLLDSMPYEKADYTRATAFMIGNESKGLSDVAAQKADMSIKINLLGRVESLNAAMAASILMYELARQRRI